MDLEFDSLNAHFPTIAYAGLRVVRLPGTRFHPLGRGWDSLMSNTCRNHEKYALRAFLLKKRSRVGQDMHVFSTAVLYNCDLPSSATRFPAALISTAATTPPHSPDI